MRSLTVIILTIFLSFTGYCQLPGENEYVRTLGNFQEFTFDENTLLIVADNGKMKITRYTDEIVKVSVCRDEFGPDLNYSVIREPEGKFSLRHNWSIFELTTESLRIVINRYPVYITFYDRDGNLLNQDDPEMGYLFDELMTYCVKKTHADEVYINPFKQFSKDSYILNGTRTGFGNDGIYVSICKGNYYAIFADNLNSTSFDFGLSDKLSVPNSFTYFNTTGQQISYFFVYRDDPVDLVTSYFYLTGNPPLPPYWCTGNINRIEIKDKDIKYLIPYELSNTSLIQNTEKSYLIKYITGNPYLINLEDSLYAIPDFTNSLASNWWRNEYFNSNCKLENKTIYRAAPKLNPKAIPNFVIADQEGFPVSFSMTANAWDFLVSRTLFMELSLHIDRPFSIHTRSYPGIHRYSHYLENREYIGADEAYKGVFSTYCYIGEDDSLHNNEIHKLRSSLRPYIYSCLKSLSKEGQPFIIPLIFKTPDDSNCTKNKFSTQYYFGPSMLFAYDLCSYEIYLPVEENYFLIANDSIYEASKHHLSPWEQNYNLPVFIKSSAIIPQNSTYIHSDTLFIHIYNGKQENTFEYYEDDGISNNYKKGQYYEREIAYNPGDKTIKLYQVNGSYPSKYRKLSFVFHGFELKKKLKLNGKSMLVNFRGKHPEFTTDNIVSPITIQY